MSDYSNIERPYDGVGNRVPGGTSPVMNELTTLFNQPAEASSYTDPTATGTSTTADANYTGVQSTQTVAGAVETQNVNTNQSLADLWITTFIRSSNWKANAVGFNIDGITGKAEFSDILARGTIYAKTGNIGGWIINETNIQGGNATLGSAGYLVFGVGDDMVEMSAQDQIYRLWAGNHNPANAAFSVTKAGAISASSGTIGGCTLSPTSIGSTLFVSGPLGKGWNISNTGTAEFQDITTRGVIRTSVFEKDTISAVNGTVLVSKSDVLGTDMTALDSSSLTISGQSSFVNNEVLRIKDGTDDEWMLVTDASGAPTYVVTRDLAASYAPNTNPIWKKGTAVVSMGVGTGAKTGFVLLDASSSYSPFVDVYGRNSNTYSDYTLHGRFGWLKGITDADVGLATTDVWGLYTDNAYIKGTVVATLGRIGSATNYWNISAGVLAAVGSGDVAIRAGMTDYFTGVGFWLGNKTGTPKFSIGSSAQYAPYMTWDGTSLNTNNMTVLDTGGGLVGSFATHGIGIINLTPTAIASNGLVITTSQAGIGYYYIQNANVNNNAIKIVDNSTTNNFYAIDVVYKGTTSAVNISNQGAGAYGLSVDSSTGFAIVASTSGPNEAGHFLSTVASTPALSTMGATILSGPDGSLSVLKLISNKTTSKGLEIDASAATGAYGAYLLHTSATSAGMYIDKTGISEGLYVNQTASSSSNRNSMTINQQDTGNSATGEMYALNINVVAAANKAQYIMKATKGNSKGTGYLLYLNDSSNEFITAAGSGDRSIRINIGGNDYWIRVYTAP